MYILSIWLFFYKMNVNVIQDSDYTCHQKRFLNMASNRLMLWISKQWNIYINLNILLYISMELIKTIRKSLVTKCRFTLGLRYCSLIGFWDSAMSLKGFLQDKCYLYAEKTTQRDEYRNVLAIFHLLFNN